MFKISKEIVDTMKKYLNNACLGENNVLTGFVDIPSMPNHRFIISITEPSAWETLQNFGFYIQLTMENNNTPEVLPTNIGWGMVMNAYVRAEYAYAHEIDFQLNQLIEELKAYCA